MVGHDDQDDHDDRDAEHVPVRRDRVEERRDADVEDVDQARCEQEERVQRIDRLVVVPAEPVVRVLLEREEVVEEHRRERREPVADRRGDGDLADQVEPAGRPAPARAAELRRPVVEPARRRERRGDLGHRERDDRGEKPDEQPAPGDRDRAAALEGDVVRGEAPRENRDDREGDREVLEPSHRAEELLGVAEPVQDPLVLGDVRTAACRGRVLAHSTLLVVCRFGDLYNGRGRKKSSELPPS